MKIAHDFIRDERGQAIVETVIVVPTVLFVFFAMFQFILFANVAQLGNFAAYSAARSMSVHLAAGQGSAIEFAKLAGAVAYSPLSQPAPGEVAHYAGGPFDSEAGYAGSYLRNTMGMDRDALETFAGMQSMGPEGMSGERPAIPSLIDQDNPKLKPVTWLFTALGRLKFVDGEDLDFSVRNIAGPALQEVNVELHYEYPMYIPGFTEMWNFLPGESTDEAVDDTPLHQALGSIFTIVIKTKCSMGIEGWSGEVITVDGREGDNGAGGANPFEGIDETTDEILDLSNQIDAKGDEMDDLKAELDALEAARTACLNAADDFDERQDCRDEFDPQIDAKQDEIDDLAEVIEALEDDMASQLEDLEGAAAGAINDGLDNINAAMNCE